MFQIAIPPKTSALANAAPHANLSCLSLRFTDGLQRLRKAAPRSFAYNLQTHFDHTGLRIRCQDFASNFGPSTAAASAAVISPDISTGSKIVRFTDNAPSWEELAEIARDRCHELQYVAPEPVAGPPNPYSLLRTFGKAEKPKLKLYRDPAAWCPHCQKVWIYLEEKQIPYEVEMINLRNYGTKPESYLKIVPSGQVPAIEIGGQVMIESLDILRHLEDTFPDLPLLPSGSSSLRAAAENLISRERTLISAWIGFVLPTLHAGNAENEEERQRLFEETMDSLEAELQARGGPYFLGADFSMVDIIFAPTLERIAGSVLYFKGNLVRGNARWPALGRWYDAMDSRSSYLATKSDYYTISHIGRILNQQVTPNSPLIMAAIDGTDDQSWSLPLPPLSSNGIEPYPDVENPAVDALVAALRLLNNRDAIIPFGLRGCSNPASSAAPSSGTFCGPLDVQEQDRPHFDGFLRHVAHALLVGTDAKQASDWKLGAVWGGEGGLDGKKAVLSCEYLRDRVCVPRDLSLPAARQLRAHLNWGIGMVRPS